MCIKFTFFLKALRINKKGKLRKIKRDKKIGYKSPSSTSNDQFHLKKTSLTEDYYYTLNLSTIAGKCTRGYF